ncbi:MAG: dockerin type I repeat-containing protein, partial [Candidatus Zixiibacteriota bacterium]
EQGWLPINTVICGDLANGSDTRFLFSFGPFDQLAPGDTLSFTVAFVIGETLHVDPLNLAQDPNMTDPDRFYANLDFSSLVQNASIAQELYNDNFFVFLPGDVTSDEAVDIADVVYLINHIFIGGAPPSPLRVADVNRDCVVDIEDVVYLINYLFLNGPPPQVGCA